MPTIKNFRRYPLSLFEKTFYIAGMAGPHRNEEQEASDDPKGIKWALHQLKAQKIDVLIGLHDDKVFSREANEAQIEYCHIPVEKSAKNRFSRTLYNEIYDAVKKATIAGKAVAIHCDDGDGRTGAALAALKLRELFEKKHREDPNILDDFPEINAMIDIHFSKHKKVACTALVQQAILDIRNEKIHGSNAVQTENDVETLIGYEMYLRGQAIRYKRFGTEAFGDCFYAGSHPLLGDDAYLVNLELLKSMGISKIFSLESKNCTKIARIWNSFGTNFCHETAQGDISYFIEDMQEPNQTQLDSIVDNVLNSTANGEKIYLHCKGGVGRTGCILAAAYMQKMRVTAEEAIIFVRETYNCNAVETQEQENALIEFAQRHQLENLSNAINFQVQKLKNLIPQIKNKQIQKAAMDVLKSLDDKEISSSIKNTVLFKTISLLQVNPAMRELKVGEYNAYAKKISTPPSKAYKRLGITMLVLGVAVGIAVGVLIGVSTLGIGLVAGGGALLGSIGMFMTMRKKELSNEMIALSEQVKKKTGE